MAALLLAAALSAALLVGGVPALLVVATGLIVVLVAARRLGDRNDLTFVISSVVILYLARQIFTMGLHLVLLPRGFDGSMFSDDYGYPRIAAALAASWKGVDFPFATDPSVVNNYTRLGGALFWLVGDSTPALKALNTALAVTAALFAYRASYLIAGHAAARWSLVLLLGFPSIVLWSSLALKDAFALFALLGATWVATEFFVRPSIAAAVTSVAFVGAVADTRLYLPVALGVAWIVSLVTWSHVRRTTASPRWLAVGFVAATVILFQPPGRSVAFRVFDLASIRQSMSEGARSAFAVLPSTEPRQVQPTSANPSAASSPASSPTTPPSPQPANPATAVPTTPPSPQPANPATAVPTTPPSPQPANPAIEPGASPDALARLWNSLSFLPIGVAYVVAAPFPWDLTSNSQLALVPELLLWYLTLAAAVGGAITLVARRRIEAAYTLVTLVLIGGVLSLAEGNIGTLLRHRAMLIPPTAIVAGVMLARWTDRLSRSRAVARLERFGGTPGLRGPLSSR